MRLYEIKKKENKSKIRGKCKKRLKINQTNENLLIDAKKSIRCKHQVKDDVRNDLWWWMDFVMLVSSPKWLFM